MRVLYHFQASPFSRRTRLALALKGLPVELRDARANPDFLTLARTLSALKTVPLLVDGDDVIGDSMAITHYLDRVAPDAPALWPREREDAALVFHVAALVDTALSAITETGNRFYPLHDNPAWPAIQTEMVSRAQRALDSLAATAGSLGRPTVARTGWSAADIWLFVLTTWFEAIPERAKSNPIIAQVLSLGWTLPPALSRWADQHRKRADVLAL